MPSGDSERLLAGGITDDKTSDRLSELKKEDQQNIFGNYLLDSLASIPMRKRELVIGLILELPIW